MEQTKHPIALRLAALVALIFFGFGLFDWLVWDKALMGLQLYQIMSLASGLLGVVSLLSLGLGLSGKRKAA